MKPQLFSALCGSALALVSAQASAEYKCAEPRLRLDRAACEKAAEGPEALRQFIQRVRAIDSLLFSDYVNEARAREWEAAAAARRLPSAPVMLAEQAERPGS